MHNLMIQHPKLFVEVTTGSEGPRHDPYHYREINITTPHGHVVLHEGIITWMTVNQVKIGERHSGKTFEEHERWLRNEAVQMFTGWKLAQIERMHRKMKSRCSKCGGKTFRSMPGYPGEHFEVCCGCNHIHDSYFCEGEIM